MLNLKYVVEDDNEVNGEKGKVIYLPMKIGEFITNPKDNSIHFQKSYVLVPESVSFDKKSHLNSKSRYDLNIGLLNNEKEVTLSGLKRKNSKTVEVLEEEVRFLNDRIDALEKDMQNIHKAFHQSTSKADEDSYILSDEDNSSSILNDSFPHRTKSGRLSASTDIAYLYSVPLVMKKNNRIESMGLPIDHNAEIDDIKKSLEETKKMVNLRIEIATLNSFQNLIMIKPKIVHLSCHGDFDKKTNMYYLAFEAQNPIGMMEKLSETSLRKLFENHKDSKSIEAMIVSA